MNIFSNKFLYCSTYNEPTIRFGNSSTPFAYTPFISFGGGNFLPLPTFISGNTYSNSFIGGNIFTPRSSFLQRSGTNFVGKTPFIRTTSQTWSIPTQNYSFLSNSIAPLGIRATSPETSALTSSTSVTKSSSIQKTSSVDKPKITSTATQKPKTQTFKQDFRSDFVNTSKKYLGFNEADGSSKMISKSGEWCADFIKYIINETYQDKGLKPPTADLKIEPGLPHLRVENIKQWGIKHGTYLSTTDKSDKASTISKYVKPGDVFILRENASHTGFVSKVYKDGSFDSIEGNRNDKVMKHHYQANDPTLSGFVQVRT